MVNINQVEFDEIFPLPDSQCEGYPNGFSAILTPRLTQPLDFTNWLTHNPEKVAEYLKTRGTAVVKNAEIQSPSSTNWVKMGSDGATDLRERVINTEPHCDNSGGSSMVLFAHKLGETARVIKSCAAPLRRLAAITRANALSASGLSKNTMAKLKKMADEANDYELTKRLNMEDIASERRSQSNGGPSCFSVEEYFQFVTNVFREARAYTAEYSGTLFPGSVFIINETEVAQQENGVVVHWKEAVANLEELDQPNPPGIFWRADCHL